MAARWVTITYLAVALLLGAVATIDPRLSIAAIAICILAVIVRTRFRPAHSIDLSTRGRQPDWIVLLIPIALASRIFSFKGSLLILGLLVAAAFIRKADGSFPIQAGPLLLLFASSAIVLSRPDYISELLPFLLVGALVIRLVMTVDARKIIASLIDGCGLYLLANVLCYAAGLRSPAETSRIGGLVESTGLVRIIYPLTESINLPPVIAAVFVAAILFLILEPGWLRRSLRLICCIAAIIVLVGAGTRTPIAVAAMLSIAVICFPFITRWLAQAATILAALSAFVLPSVMAVVQSGITPLMSLSPGRVSTAESVGSLEGRGVIWDLSIKYWVKSVNDLPHMLFGFGMNGHYRSGASREYSDLFIRIVKDPQISALMHNSFLQQLFDGGILGWLLLTIAAYWASARLSKRRRDWGNAGLSAIVAMSVLLLSGMTEAYFAPAVTEEGFWLLVVLVGVACQGSGRQPEGRRFTTHDDAFTLDQGETRSTSFEKSASMKGGASETGSRDVLLQ
jgi:O-antigen ligase